VIRKLVLKFSFSVQVCLLKHYSEIDIITISSFYALIKEFISVKKP